MNAIGWAAEKAEGLTLIDDSTIALANDNDFGLKTKIFDANGVEVDGADVTRARSTPAAPSSQRRRRLQRG